MNSSGFVAGTLVHTDKGLVPIQDTKLGDMVLSASANAIPSSDKKLETAYKPITQVFKSAEKKPLLTPLGHPSILCTANHLFWTKEKGWIRADDLNYQINIYKITPCDGYHYYHNMFEVLEREGNQILDGDAEYNQMFLSETPFEGIVVGFERNSKSDASKERWYNDPYIYDFNKNRYIDSDGPYTIPSNLRVFPCSDKPTEQEILVYVEAFEYVTGYQYYDPYKATVYNIEVEDHDTYFVGKHGVWVHDASLNN
ncbi:hypothetical protein ACTXJ5_01280 [Psychrobacter alimentarius]|uniref:hypothetical protein n=1 Tax=Psychrobacter alimentarius TaxID=261164 RepID=UPI003FD5D51D